jgi:hypothetical protein
LPPVGLMFFSFGDGGALLGGGGVVVVAVVVAVVDGACFPLGAHAAVCAPSAMSATPQTTRTT